MSQALPGGHYCATHQGNHSHYDESNCELCRAQRERDEARAEVERLRKTLDEIATYWNGSHRPAETLDAAEWTQGVAEEALAATEAKP